MLNTLEDNKPDYGRHQLLVDCVKGYIELNKIRVEFVEKSTGLRITLLEEGLAYFDKDPAAGAQKIKQAQLVNKVAKEAGAISLPTDPKQWNRNHLKAMATSNKGFDEGFACLITLYNAAVATDKNGYYTPDAMKARSALLNEFTPISVSAQANIDNIIWQNKHAGLTKDEAVKQIVDVRSGELKNFMDNIQSVAIETAPIRKKLSEEQKKAAPVKKVGAVFDLPTGVKLDDSDTRLGAIDQQEALRTLDARNVRLDTEQKLEVPAGLRDAVAALKGRAA